MKKYLIIFFLSIVLFSCSEDDNNNPTNNTTEKNYFPLKSGNYWFYEHYDLDMQNQIKQSSKRNDSIVNGESVNYLGKAAFPFTQYSWIANALPVENGKYHFYYENQKIYCETKYILPSSAVFGLPIDKIENKWVVLADFLGTNWDVFSHQFANETINLPNSPVALKLTANYTVKASKSNTNTKISINNIQYDAIEIVLNHNIKGTIGYTIFNFPIEIVLTQRFYYVDKIGLVRSLLESKKVELNLGALGTQSFDIEGYQKNLIRYKVQ